MTPTTAMLQLPARTLLTVKDVAAALDCHAFTVRRWIWAGDLPSVRVGRSVRVPREALAAYLVRGSRAPQAHVSMR